MSSCMKLHKQPQPFPKEGAEPLVEPLGRSKEKSTNHPSRNRQKTITQAGTKGSQGLSRVDISPSTQTYIQVLFQQTLFCSASSPTYFSFSPSTGLL